MLTTALLKSMGRRQEPELRHVLYLGSYVDLSPSMVWPGVTYVDFDKRAKKFFSDEALVAQQLQNRIYRPQTPEARFVHGDFNFNLPLHQNSFDLVNSLYSGPSLEAALRTPFLKERVNRQSGSGRKCI